MGKKVVVVAKPDRTVRIRELNDQFRTTGVGGRVLVTARIAALGDQRQSAILAAVASFASLADFTADNDPHGEHDCASIEVQGHRIIWKIDYYDPAYRHHSDDPANADITRRVLTIMLTEEY